MGGGGTGYAYTFSCPKCHQGDSFWREEKKPRPGFVRTGKTKPLRSGEPSWRRGGNERVKHEYECLACGHVGFSKHPDIARAKLKDGVHNAAD